MSKKVVVVGAGFSGCGAAAAAARAGVEVTLLEKTDTLTGVGQTAGGFARGEQFVANEELKEMGAGDIAEALESTVIWSRTGGDKIELHRDCRIGPEAVGKALKKLGVNIMYRALASDVEMSGTKVKALKLKDGEVLEADAIVDATGGAGPTAMCTKYGHGCVTCMMMCTLFGGRVSIAAKAGAKEYAGLRVDGKTPGAYSNAVDLVFETLSPELQQALKEKGTLNVPVPEEFVEPIYQRRQEERRNDLDSDFYTRESAKRIILSYGGYVSVARDFYIKREELKRIRGLENAVIISPAAGWVGNSIRFMAITPRDNTLKAEGADNLFVAGEKVGHLQSVTPCYITGAVAGHNAARKAVGLEPLELPRTTAIGELIAHSNELNQKDRLIYSVFNVGRLKKVGLLTTDVPQIQARVKEQGFSGVFSRALV